MRIYYFDQKSHDLIQYDTETKELSVFMHIEKVKVFTGSDVQMGDVGEDNGKLKPMRMEAHEISHKLNKRTKITPEMVEKIKEMRKDKSVREISELLGVSQATIWNKLK